MRAPLTLPGLLLTAACGGNGDPATSDVESGGSSAASGGSSAGGQSTSSGGSSVSAGGTMTGGSSGGTGGTMATGPDAGTSGSPTMDAGVTGGTGAVDASAGTGGGSQTLSFAADIWPVYELIREPPFVFPGGTTYESCVTGGVCHGGETPGAQLSMPDAATAYEMLFEVPSTTSLCDGTIRVVPGDPDQSCLVIFYEGRLRDQLGWVEQAEIDLMREWIAEGAQP